MQPIIVIGMHRSGSSLLVKVLQELGVFMGNDFEENNESMFFNKINDWRLLQAGASWDIPENLFQGFDQSRRFAFVKEKQLVEFYGKIKNDELVVKSDYGNMI